MTDNRTPVTVLGLGPMGQALAGAFLRAGHPTTVWNRTASRADELVAQGAVLAATPAEAVAASPLTVLCVLDYDAAEAIVRPAAAELKGRTLVNLTADVPERSRAMASWAADNGVGYLDGAIMTPTITIGGPGAVFLYSGPKEVYDRVAGALESLGGTGTHLGEDPGRAAAYDLALLDVFWTSMGGLIHAFALARAEGVTARDLAPFAQGIAALVGDLIPQEARDVDERDYPGETSGISSNVATMDHIIHAAEHHGIDSGAMRALRAVAQRAIDAGHATDGFSRTVETLVS
ncbi:NAD(P)-dependent oxidoreductase [Bailinhaonella thermotolerans]|uniref:NAD(P)-dependent oxidoreductase n=1 Tax=Bailinhaonella thermotolerans TaxID=1070861 RepID=A0A3A4BNS3_9ACTN|nr:NAD(P)-binding domain-containing protein [Bailinhaonella thermotolerans]RJL32714.1 NAD(P)-dependent oxidoreductase [Bailinhaonella thermotolerans]